MVLAVALAPLMPGAVSDISKTRVNGISMEMTSKRDFLTALFFLTQLIVKCIYSKKLLDKFNKKNENASALAIRPDRH